jgi:hypothetical protein
MQDFCWIMYIVMTPTSHQNTTASHRVASLTLWPKTQQRHQCRCEQCGGEQSLYYHHNVVNEKKWNAISLLPRTGSFQWAMTWRSAIPGVVIAESVEMVSRGESCPWLSSSRYLFTNKAARYYPLLLTGCHIHA